MHSSLVIHYVTASLPADAISVHVHKHIHAYIYTYMHTYIHTYIQTMMSQGSHMNIRHITRAYTCSNTYVHVYKFNMTFKPALWTSMDQNLFLINLLKYIPRETKDQLSSYCFTTCTP